MTVDASPPRASIRLRPLTHALLAVFTLATALAINPYYYGVGDNRITIPLLKHLIHPELYPGDAMVAQGRYYYTFLWKTLALVHRVSHLQLSWIFLGVYLVALYATFLGFYRLALSLFRDSATATISLLMLAFSRLTLGGIPTLDQTLTTRLVAVPILLFALRYLLEEKVVRSFALLGVAYLVHPLTAQSGVAMVVVSWLVVMGRRGLPALALGLLAFLAVVSPMILWRLGDAPPSLHLFNAEPDWLKALHIRSAHHLIPSLGDIIHAGVAAVLFVIVTHTRNTTGSRADRMVWWAAWTVLALAIAGVGFSTVRPIGLALMLQPLRGFLFFELFVMVYATRYFTAPHARSRPVLDAVTAVLVCFWMGHGSDTSFRPFIQYLILAAAIIVHKFRWLEPAPVARFALLPAALICLAGGSVRILDLKWSGVPAFSIESIDPPDWLDVQRWARSHTQVGDGFIVPPEESGEFRVEGERTVYVDWEEGSLMNFNPAYGREWTRRMNMLGYWDRPFATNVLCHLGVPRVLAAASEIRRAGRRVFLVSPCSVALTFPVRYRNETYTIYEVTAPGEPLGVGDTMRDRNPGALVYEVRRERLPP